MLFCLCQNAEIDLIKGHRVLQLKSLVKFFIRFEKSTPFCERHFSKNLMYLDVAGRDQFSHF